jgi:hypothetical protein
MTDPPPERRRALDAYWWLPVLLLLSSAASLVATGPSTAHGVVPWQVTRYVVWAGLALHPVSVLALTTDHRYLARVSEWEPSALYYPMAVPFLTSPFVAWHHPRRRAERVGLRPSAVAE